MMKALPIFLLLAAIITASCSQNDQSSDASHSCSAVPVSLDNESVVFTDIQKVSNHNSSDTIINRLIDLINAASDSSDIYMSIYLFDKLSLFKAIEMADTRGVKCSVIIDQSKDKSINTNSSIITKLKSLENSQIISFVNDAGASTINHNKFVLFSGLETTPEKQEKVVFQTSHNFTTAGTKKIQDAVVLCNTSLYNAYRNYWTELKKLSSSGMNNYTYTEYADAEKNYTACFMPKRKGGKVWGEDSIVEFLDTLNCSGNTSIKIGMSGWTIGRTAIIASLKKLIDKGASVEIITKDSNEPDLIDALNQLTNKGAWVKVYTQTNIHSKFMLVKTTGERTCTYILTGSHNYTVNALRNNAETLLVLRNSALYYQYDSAYNEMKMIN